MTNTPTVVSLLRYIEHPDGFMRMQLVRYEIVELTEAPGEGGSTDQSTQSQDTVLGSGDGTTGPLPSADGEGEGKREIGTSAEQPEDGTMREYIEKVCHDLMLEASDDTGASLEEDLLGQDES